MLCARRGESWKQKHFTLYPSSASVAAADPPASPEPTTMMLYLRLLAGLTSFRSNRCLSQRVSIGPVGHFDFSSIYKILTRPARTAIGTAINPAISTHANTAENFLIKGVYRGWLNPID